MNLPSHDKLVRFVIAIGCVVLLILAFDNVLMYSGGKPLISNLNPLLYLVSVSTTFIVPLLIFIIYLKLIIEKKYFNVLKLSISVAVIVVSVIVTNNIVRNKAISNSYNIIVMVLTGKNKYMSNKYHIDVLNDAKVDYEKFTHDFDSSAINLYSALTQYQRYQYIVQPKSKVIKPFMVVVQNEDSGIRILITNEGVERYIKYLSQSKP